MVFLIKSGLLMSWFVLIVMGWMCLYNIGLGVFGGLMDLVMMVFFSVLGVFVLVCGLMLWYMFLYSFFLFKWMLVSSGFGGVLLLMKVVVIYLGFCFLLVGYFVFKDVFFF